jgi:hypothetical protein
MKYGATIPGGNDCVWDAYDNRFENVLDFLTVNGKKIPSAMLVEAVRTDDLKGVRILVRCRAWPRDQDIILSHVTGPITPEKAEIVRLLCDAGADVNVRDPYDFGNGLIGGGKRFLDRMVDEYVRTKNEHSFAVIKKLIAKGAEPPPLEMYNTMSEFKKNPVDYMQMNVLFMKARWAAKKV